MNSIASDTPWAALVHHHRLTRPQQQVFSAYCWRRNIDPTRTTSRILAYLYADWVAQAQWRDLWLKSF